MSDRTISLLGVAFGLAQVLVGAWSADWDPQKAGPISIIFLAFALLSLGAVGGYRFARRRHAHGLPDRSACERLVWALHKRWFPGDVAGLDPGYRVSLFVPHPSPSRVERWDCIARTSSTKASTSWKHVTSPADLRYGGIVVRAAVEQSNLHVPGVVLDRREDAGELQRYRQSSCIDERTLAERSWPWATLQARIARLHKGTILCVFLVERQSGEPIVMAGRKDMRMIQGDGQSEEMGEVELQLATDVWSVAWEEK